MKRCLYWRVVRRTYPWMPLLILGWRVLITQGNPHDRTLIRFWMLVYRLDLAGLMAIAMDLIQPEYWA